MRYTRTMTARSTYASRGIVVDIFGLLLGGDGHKAFEDSGTQVVALDFGFFAAK